MSLEQQIVPQTGSFDPAALRRGDVLLMLGKGELSKLIAWFGDSIYSHAAMVYDSDNLVEAGTAGVLKRSLAQRMQAFDLVEFIDAYRPLTFDLLPMAQADLDLVAEHAQSLLGRSYAMDDLFLVGALVAVRDKTLPVQDVRLRWLLHVALDHVVHNSDAKLMCSEYVYRCFAENTATPRGRLAPRIVLSSPTDAPFPKVDWEELMKEVLPLLLPQRRAALTANAAPGTVDFAAAAEGLDDDALAAAKVAARAALGGGAGLLTADAGGDDPFPRPNPKMVTPHDLEETPSHTVLGRVMQAPVAVVG